MVSRTDYGFPFLLTGDNEQAPMPHRQSDLDERYADAQHNACTAHRNADYSNVVPIEWKTDAQRRLDRAKAIAAEVCARRFPVTKIPKEQQE